MHYDKNGNMSYPGSSSVDKVEELTNTIKWIIERIESEADKVLEGKRPNWKAAAIESVEEAYGALASLKEIYEQA